MSESDGTPIGRVARGAALRGTGSHGGGSLSESERVGRNGPAGEKKSLVLRIALLWAGGPTCRPLHECQTVSQNR